MTQTLLKKNEKPNIFARNGNKIFLESTVLAKLTDQINNLDIFKIVYEDQGKIEEEAARFDRYDQVLVIGTGGSSLGAKALTEFKALSSGIPSKIRFLENVDAQDFLNNISSCDPAKTGVIVISKSGRTSETLMTFASLIEKWSDFNWRENSLVITENSEHNDLKQIANKLNIRIIDHPQKIGGRFSVFSVVGLLPSAIAGVTIKDFINGAKKCLSEVLDNQSNIFQEIEETVKVLKKGVNHHVIFPYSNFLQGFGRWAIQLISESLGKRGDFGINPISATGTIDQHSQLQLFLGGPADKYFSVISQKTAPDTGKINAVVGSSVMQTLNNHSIGDLMKAHQRATVAVLKKRAHVREFEFEELNEEALGYLMMLFVVETVAIANFFEINPFDQPAVEESKKLALEHYLIEL